MEDFQKRFKISIRDLKCKKNVLNENLSNNHLKKSRKISKHLKKSRGDKRKNHFNNSKHLKKSRKISNNLET